MTRNGFTWRDVVSRAAGGAAFQRIGVWAAAVESAAAAAARTAAESGGAVLALGVVSSGVVCAKPAVATARLRATTVNTTRSAETANRLRKLLSLLGPCERDGEKQDKEGADSVDREDGALSDARRDGRMAKEIIDALPECHDERREEHERPPPPKRDDDDDPDEGDNERVMPIHREPPAAQILHVRAARSRDGGNVWESNPPRTAEPPDRRI